MQQVETLFGSTPLHRVGTFNMQEEGKLSDLYVTRLRDSKSTNKIVAMLFTPHNPENPGVMTLSTGNWNTFMVRSYPHEEALQAAIKKINVTGGVGKSKAQSIKAAKWGNMKDVVVKATKRTDDYTIYNAEGLGFEITGFPDSGNQLGNDLEVVMELIPLLQSYNFCIRK